MQFEFLWRIEQGQSRATVRARNYAEAKARASELGFTDPETIYQIGEAPPRHLTPIRRNWSGAKRV